MHGLMMMDGWMRLTIFCLYEMDGLWMIWVVSFFLLALLVLFPVLSPIPTPHTPCFLVYFALHSRVCFMTYERDERMMRHNFPFLISIRYDAMFSPALFVRTPRWLRHFSLPCIYRRFIYHIHLSLFIQFVLK